MTEEMRGPVLVRDDALTAHLRAIYAAPVEGTYWAGLEQRILDRVERRKDEGRWWAVSERAYRLGLAAAALTLIVAGSVYLRSRAVESQMAYQRVLEPSVADQPVFARRGPLDH